MSAPAAIVSAACIVWLLVATTTRNVVADASYSNIPAAAANKGGFQIGAVENYLNRVNLKETLPTTTIRIAWRTSQPISGAVSINRAAAKFEFMAAPTAATTPISPTITNPSNILLDQSALNASGNHGNKSRMEILEEHLGPQKKPIGFVISMSTVYILILICGLVGNISTCCVIICNNCMHTTTNYYLFSLAVSDVLSLLTGLPIELYNIIIEAYPWPFGTTICLMRTFIFETTTIASVLTILTFTFERWLHICKAMFAKKFSSGFSRALKIIVFIWTLSGLLALPYTFTTGVYNNVDGYPESKSCNTLEAHKHFMVNVIKLSVFFLFVVPMTLISIMYVLIGITLWKSNQIRSRAKERRNILSHSSFMSSSGQSNLSVRLCKFFKQAKFTGGGGGGEENGTAVVKESVALTMPGEQLYGLRTHQGSSKNSANNKNNNNNKKPASSTSNGDAVTVNNNRLSVKIDAPPRRHMSEISIENFSQAVSQNGGGGQHSTSQRNRTSKEFEHISYRARQSRRDVVKMLFVVVLGFFICWAPYHSQRVMAASASEVSFKSEFMMKILEYLYYISGITIYISSTINPIVYNVFSKRYRTAFINTLKMICSCSCNTKANSAAYHRSSNYYLSKNSTMKFNQHASVATRHNSMNNSSRYKVVNTTSNSTKSHHHHHHQGGAANGTGNPNNHAANLNNGMPPTPVNQSSPTMVIDQPAN